MTEVVWESEAKNKAGDSFLTVKRNGRYLFSQRAGIDSVAFILYDRKVDKFCAISERKPPLDERFDDEEIFLTTAFGGSLDDVNATKLDIVRAEVREEAGFEVTDEQITELGGVMVSTQSNQVAYLYLVDVDMDKQLERQPETEMEAMAEMVWFDIEEAHEFKDWKLATILFKAKWKDII